MIKDFFVLSNNCTAIEPVNFGHHNCESSHHFGPAVRMHWLIHFVESGFGVFKIDGKEYQIRPGEMFVIPPLAETYYEADSENPWSYIWIGFNVNGELPVKLDHKIRCPKALDTFRKILSCSELANGKNAYLISCIWELFSLLLEAEEPEIDFVQEALRYIHSEYMNDISVAGIAKRLNLDRSYFSTAFKNKIGLSPAKYLFNYRMSVAVTLLTNNKKSVTTAANSVGYADIYSFSRMFKRHFGVSPSTYAKMHVE